MMSDRALVGFFAAYFAACIALLVFMIVVFDA